MGFGAFDGVHLSNTYFFEKKFTWRGILAEPNQIYFDKCCKNRTCIVDHRCVWSDSRRHLNFSMVPKSPELATLELFENSDCHMAARQVEKSVVSVETISLLDLLIEHRAPRSIDYMSIDTEGTELEILRSFDFNRYLFKIISVEHNFTVNREKLFELLTGNGYFRLPRSVSYCDDMYINTARSPHLSRINHWLQT